MMIEDLRGKAMPITGGAVPKRRVFEAARTVQTPMHEPSVRRFLEEHFA